MKVFGGLVYVGIFWLVGARAPISSVIAFVAGYIMSPFH